jgi:hypothetical protein
LARPVSVLSLAAKRWPDKLSRLRDGFYSIRDKGGTIVPFRMNEAQEGFIHSRHGMDVILKARQAGFTTVIQLDMLDDCLFIPNTSCGVIAHNLNDAKAFFRDKIKFAYDQLPVAFKEATGGVMDAEQDASDSLRFANGSSIRVGTSLRSGTLQRLHISEYGKLCAKHPEKAKEVQSGAFNTVQVGQRITVESTAEGMGGHFYDLCQEAQRMQEAGGHLTPLDFKFHFSAWHTTQEYRLDPYGVVITKEDEQYFQKLSEAGIKLDDEQKAWYVKKALQQQDHMKREYPSLPKEAFEASVEGAYFGSQMTAMRKQGRICKLPILDAPVYTTWDLGVGDNMCITFWQDVGLERRAIDYYENSGEGFGHYARILNERGYNYSKHYMPHDADQRRAGVDVTSQKLEAIKAGIAPIETLGRIKSEQTGIEASRSFFPNVYIDEVRCARLIACLDNYRREWNDKLGVFKDYPLHDEFSHGYKSFETAAIRPQRQISRPINYSAPGIM